VRNMELKIGLSNGGFGAERFVASLFAFTSFGSLNSGYAVRLRSSKPLRVSHTRRTLASRSILIDIEQEKIKGGSK